MKQEISKFKSFKPRIKLTREEYAKRYHVPYEDTNTTERGHYYRELCANCKKPYGGHYGDKTIAKCNITL